MSAESHANLTLLRPAHEPEAPTKPISLLEPEAVASLINRFADSLAGEGRFYVDAIVPVYGRALIEQLARESDGKSS